MERMFPYCKRDWYAVSDKIKETIATFIGARGGHEIAYVPNTSSGLSLVAKGIDWRKGDDVVITNVEYPANRYPWEDLKRFGVNVIEVAQQPDGRVDLDDTLEAITDRTFTGKPTDAVTTRFEP